MALLPFSMCKWWLFMATRNVQEVNDVTQSIYWGKNSRVILSENDIVLFVEYKKTRDSTYIVKERSDKVTSLRESFSLDY